MNEKLTDLLESDKQNGGFEIFNADQIIFNVTAAEKEVDDDVEDSVFDLKPPNGHSEAESMLSKCIDWFEV